MNKTLNSQSNIVRQAFVRVMIVNTIVMLATNLNSLVDGMCVGHLLGSQALAAIGFFSPVTTAIALTYTMIMGSQVLCGHFIGAAKHDQLNRLFFSISLFLGVLSVAISVLLIVFAYPLAGILGAKGSTQSMLSEYIVGYAPGILFQVMNSFLIGHASYNNVIRRSYYAIGVMVVVNFLCNIVLSNWMGILGIGLASTASCLCSWLVIGTGFLGKDKALCVRWAHFDVSLLLSATVKGLPMAFLLWGVVIKNYLFNSILSEYAGDDAIAVVNVLASSNNILCAFPTGVCGAFLALAAIYVGEDDRESFVSLSRIAFRYGIIGCVIIMVSVMALSFPLVNLFFEVDATAREMAQRMFFLNPLFLVPNVIMYILLRGYQAQGKSILVNGLSFLDPVMVGVITMIVVPVQGTDGAWLSNTYVDLMCLTFVLAYAFYENRGIAFTYPVLLRMSDDFGAPEGAFFTFKIFDVNSSVDLSIKIIDFCRAREVEERKAIFAGLCAEELAINIITYGFSEKEDRTADVRVVKKDTLKIRFRDNCPEFDPKTRMDLIYPDSPERNIGTRIVYKLADNISYYNNAGINTLLIEMPTEE